MSTRVETYVIYGRKLDIDLFKAQEDRIPEELYFPWCGEGTKNTLGVLYDGMNGEYCIAGYCIAVGSEWNGNDLGLVEINPFNLDIKMMDTTEKWIAGHGLDEYRKPEYEDDYAIDRIWILTHYH